MFNKMKVAKQRKTSVVRNSLSLSINETFEFTVEDDAIQNTYFVIELKDSSMFPKGSLKKSITFAKFWF